MMFNTHIFEHTNKYRINCVDLNEREKLRSQSRLFPSLIRVRAAQLFLNLTKRRKKIKKLNFETCESRLRWDWHASFSSSHVVIACFILNLKISSHFMFSSFFSSSHWVHQPFELFFFCIINFFFYLSFILFIYLSFCCTISG